ncbi:energy-coupling factor ABC transporter permease [Shewanella sp. AS16]|uniref:energy-coupling factor ABC transporter permease n=1 Tax=Shewanella sp. AS16 TaxID=2907625 RepID=UPI001F48AF01|nr:energy-coupling factor ABC transporter permease [Shewanella sp. AS16]MCE9684868.1 energy-coupling factor ABC transporter permease [Shewanella sp. AS16]
MIDYWSHLFADIDWQFTQADAIALGLLLLWLKLIWPAEDIKSLLADKSQQSRLLLTLVGINGLWLLNASIMPGLDAHFLGLVTCMLMFGWRLSCVALLLPVAFFSLLLFKQPAAMGAYALFGVCLPLGLSFAFYSWSYHKLPRNLFVFIFCGAFINAGLSMVTHELGWALWLLLATDYDWPTLVDNYLLLIPLLGFPEALLNGMAVTLLVVYRPLWLYDYSDRAYFWRQ